MIVPERVKRTCHLCRRRRDPAAMDGTRCADRESCLRAIGRRVTVAAPTAAEKVAAIRERREAGRRA